MKKLFKIAIPLYKGRLNVFFGSIKECAKALRKDGRPEHKIIQWQERTMNCHGAYYCYEDYRLIWFSKLPESIDDYGTLVHEIEHATFDILQNRGLRHSDDSDEAYAYLMSFLFCEIDNYVVSQLFKNNNKKRKKEKNE